MSWPYNEAVLANIFGPDVLIVVLLAVVLLFGATQLPKMARSFGEARRELKKGLDDKNVNGDPTPSRGNKPRKVAKSDKATKVSQPNDHITMTKDELQALIDQRLDTARRDPGPPLSK
jgi:sec-independent protein translocase protein TatA